MAQEGKIALKKEDLEKAGLLDPNNDQDDPNKKEGQQDDQKRDDPKDDDFKRESHIDPKEEEPKNDPKKEESSANEIEIDDVVYTLDENGNAVKDGEIVFTKEKIDELISQNEDSPINIEDISKLSGINLVNESGETIEFENSIEGLAQREVAILRQGESQGFQKGFNKFLEDNPDIKDILEYKNRFGTLEGYKYNVDYSKIELPESEDGLWNLIYTAEIKKGTSVERAKRIADFSKNESTLKEDAQESLNFLKSQQEAEIRARKDKEEAALQEQIQKEIEFYGIDYTDKGEVVYDIPGSVYDMIVKTGKIGNLKVPENGIVVKTSNGPVQLSRKDLFDYIAKPVKEINGSLYSQAMIDQISRLNNPTELVLQFIRNLNGGMEQLVKETVDDSKAKSVLKLKTKLPKGQSSKTNRKDDTPKKIVIKTKTGQIL